MVERSPFNGRETSRFQSYGAPLMAAKAEKTAPKDAPVRTVFSVFALSEKREHADVTYD